MLIDRTINTKSHSLEPPERAHNRTRRHTKYDPLRLRRVPTRREHEMVKHVCTHKHGEIQRWKLWVSMNISVSVWTQTVMIDARNGERMLLGP